MRPQQRLVLIRLVAVAMLLLLTLPSQPVAAAGLGLGGQLAVQTGGFDTNSSVLSFDLATGAPQGSFLAGQPGNGRGVAFDAEGNVLATWLASTPPGNFGGDGKIHKFPRTGGGETSSITVGVNLGAITFDLEENVVWGAEYQPVGGFAKLHKINPQTGAILHTCSLPFDDNPPGSGGAGNDTLAIARIGGVKVLLTDASDGVAASTTLYALNPAAPGCPQTASYLLQRNGLDVRGVTGAAVDPVTGHLIVATIRPDETSTDIVNFGPPPYNTGVVGTPLNISGVIFGVAIDTLLDNFNRADGTRYLGNLGPSWTGAVNGGTYRIASNALKVQNSGYIYWNPTQFGANQKAFVSFRQVSPTATEQDLLLKVKGIASDGGAGGGGGGNSWSAIEVQYDAVTQKVLVNTHVPPTYPRPQWHTHLQYSLTLNANDQLQAEALADGTVKVYKNGVLTGQVNVTQGTNPFPAALAAGGGNIGLWVIGAGLGVNASIMDNFGGGTFTP